ncbi:low affinity immunoglobulin gamma Fc region receptor III-like isoform X2 [Anomalospiza imberbis]|uniref:low affinity immunoglobulin gamma Fc region receptor III-like isoform X2 n=1 Tax=Anomalospiza imberbis TaxID=187417 RepID=UPI00358E25F5
MAGDTGMAGKVALLLWAQTLGLAGWCPLSPAGAQTTQLLVEPPWLPAVLWERVTLTCQGSGTAGATTWYRDGQRWGQQGRDHVTVTESGTYRCARPGSGFSPPVTASDDWLVLQVPARALLEGDTVTLRCRGWWNNAVTRVSFYHEGKELRVLRDGTELSLLPLQLKHSGRYSCKGRVEYRGWKESAPVTVTVQVPVANATITPGPPAHRVRAGDPVSLRCSVQVGSAPVTFTWLHNGQEVAWGPLLELGNVSVGHSGTYQCVATNQLGQDGHRVFQALSPVLALEVTPGSSWLTVAVNVGRTLLFLLLLLAVIGGCHWWHRRGG